MKYSIIEYDFNRPTNKVLKEPLDSDYIEIDGESYFGAYFDFTMAGEYTTTFDLKYANE